MPAPKSKKQQTSEDAEVLKSEVASFASSLGLASSVPSSGFDDSDFRKTGPFKPQRNATKPNEDPVFDNSDDENPLPHPKRADAGSGKFKPKLNAKKSPLDNIEPFGTSVKKPAWKKDQHKLPLVKAVSLGQWYVDADELEAKVFNENDGGKVPAKGVDQLKALVASKKDLAEKLLRQYTEDYQSSSRNNGDMRMVEKAVRSGTTADKVAALTCLIEDNPIANMKSIDSLLHTVTTKVGKRYAFTSFDALKELFLFRLLPDRKLKCLLQRPLDNLPESKDGFSLLLFWYWEECLKQRYEHFVIALEEASKDMLPNLKDKSVKLIHSLLQGKAEQERRLLSALVNKLGDPIRKSASGAGYHLSCLLTSHPNMKAVVIDEVDSFIFRPHVGLRAKYHAVNFLSQIFLTKKGDGPKVAKRLIDVYFALFKVVLCLHKYSCHSPSLNSQILPKVLIMEVNGNKKVSKYSKHEKTFDKHKRKKFNDFKRGVHSYKKKNEHQSDSNVEMDSRLLSALLTGVNRAFPYIASDEVDDLVEIQTPILFRLVHSDNFNVGVQALMLLYQITSKNQIASDRFYRALYHKLMVPAALNTSKPEMFLGLLVKAMKNDINVKRISAFAKRILQVSLHQPPQYACGCLFMLSEVLKARPQLWNMMLENESFDQDLEQFEDILETPQDVQGSGVVHDDCEEGRLKTGKSSECNDEQHQKGFSLPAGYDPRHREPSYCNADRTSWWELTVLASHVHPSVATMARTLLSGANIVYNGDPINDLSLVAFLDKFMEKKPKSTQRVDGAWHGGSQIAPPRKLDMNNQLIGDQILQLAEEDVPAEDLVFHKFYMNKSTSSKKLKKKRKVPKDDEDGEDLISDSDGEVDADDEVDDEEIDNMLGLENLSSEAADEDYDYDDLDKVANEDDEDLLGNDEDSLGDDENLLGDDENLQDDDEDLLGDDENLLYDDGNSQSDDEDSPVFDSD